MSRLIDADKLPHTVARFEYGQATDVVLKRDVDSAPTIDVVEVVRCRDCKNADRFKCADGITRALCDQVNLSGVMDLDFYCAYGEREG